MASPVPSVDSKPLLAARRFLEHVAGLVDLPIGVELWDGSIVPLGQEAPREGLRITVASAGALGSLLRRPGIAHLLQLHAEGQVGWVGGSLPEVIAAVRARPLAIGWKDLDKGLLAQSLWTLARVRGQDTGEGETFHRFPHEVSEAFLGLALGTTMQDSPVHAQAPGQDLDDAQARALERQFRRLRLQPGDRVLDMACGWGGLACHAALHGAEVTCWGATRAQQAAIMARALRLGVAERIAVETGGLYALRGQFDRIIAIGQFGTVDRSADAARFRLLARLLKPGGMMLLQAMTRRSRHKRGLFGQRQRSKLQGLYDYILPVPVLDHMADIVEVMEAAGLEMRARTVVNPAMADTARHWYERLEARRGEAVALEGEARTRLWLAYLAGLSAAFEAGGLNLVEIFAQHRGHSTPA